MSIYYSEDLICCVNCKQAVDMYREWETQSLLCVNCDAEMDDDEDEPNEENRDELFERLDEMASIDLSDAELDMLGRTRGE